MTYFIAIYVTACIRFQMLVLLPEDGNRQPKHVEEGTVLCTYTFYVQIIGFIRRNIQ
jgi:hypothetical protein